MATHDKAIILSKWSAGVLATIFSAFAVGGFTFAWNVNAQMQNVEELNDAHLLERMVKIEEQGKNMSEDIDDIKESVKEVNKKLDIIIQGGNDDRRERLNRVGP
jgi:hypothetical protein